MAAHARELHDVVIVSAARTPIGSFLGSLSSVPAPTLGATAIRAAVERAGIAPADVGLVEMGCVLQAGTGQAPARQAAIGAGLPDGVAAMTVNKACGSGLQTVIDAARAIALGEVSVAVAGGMESMSLAPHLTAGLRTGHKMGGYELLDSMLHDGLVDPFSGAHMGNHAELCAREHGFSRDDQDAFAIESYRRAVAAQASGAFDAEITPVTVHGRRGDVEVTRDEEPARGDASRMPTLRPAFEAGGTVTAGNASTINDGAAAVVVMSADEADRRGAPVLARVRGWGVHAQAPEHFTTAPAPAIRNALAHAGVAQADVDLWEINEAFAVVALANMALLAIDPDRLNVHGGAVALGHPVGASGTRLLVTLLSAMEQRDAHLGGVSLCIGGGEGIAMIVERS